MNEIRSKAYNILNKLNIDSMPVDVDFVAKQLNCEIQRIDPDDLPNDFPCDKNKFSGAIIKMEDKNYILLNKYDSLKRQKFTIAHELGHLVLENTDNVDCRENMYSKDKSELNANEFAGSLLMPKEWMKEVIDIIDDNYELANIFQVSKQAIEIRRRNIAL